MVFVCSLASQISFLLSHFGFIFLSRHEIGFAYDYHYYLSDFLSCGEPEALSCIQP